MAKEAVPGWSDGQTWSEARNTVKAEVCDHHPAVQLKEHVLTAQVGVNDPSGVKIAHSLWKQNQDGHNQDHVACHVAIWRCVGRVIAPRQRFMGLGRGTEWGEGGGQGERERKTGRGRVERERGGERGKGKGFKRMDVNHRCSLPRFSDSVMVLTCAIWVQIWPIFSRGKLSFRTWTCWYSDRPLHKLTNKEEEWSGLLFCQLSIFTERTETVADEYSRG